MSPPRELLLYVQNQGLFETLSTIGRQFAGFDVRRLVERGDVTSGSVVITTTMDCSAGGCAALTGNGATVVILASFPGAFEQAAYLRAGAAAYLLMSVDAALVDLLGSLEGPRAES